LALRTFENQLMSHRPGVPHGQAGVPPWSIQAGTVKSRWNHQFMAEEMTDPSAAEWLNWTAVGMQP
jgi:hypothetical protein